MNGNIRITVGNMGVMEEMDKAVQILEAFSQLGEVSRIAVLCTLIDAAAELSNRKPEELAEFMTKAVKDVNSEYGPMCG